MSDYELQVLATNKPYDEKIRASGEKNTGILSSVVRGSRFHEAINNPIDSGIDESQVSR